MRTALTPPPDPEERGLVADAAAIFTAAVNAARPDRLYARLAAADPAVALPPWIRRARRVAIVGAGKGSIPLAGAVEAALLEHGRAPDAYDGIVTVPHGYARSVPPDAPPLQQVRVVEGGHPVPDAAGARAAAEALAAAHSLGEGGALVALVTGGASALWPAFDGGISLADARRVSHLLLRSGADIGAVNAVRKHLSRVGGGQLAAAAYPAAVHALVVSDVVGDDPAVIGSGPTVADPTTFADAAAVLRGCALWDAVPPTVRRHLDAGLRGEVAETPKPADPRLARAHTTLLGANQDALGAARAEAERRGYRARVVARDTAGEARDVGREQAHALAAAAGPLCLLWGGETTVTVRGSGRGGRNQELALGAAIALDGTRRGLVLLSGGTDGVDGPTDAAGAWATPRTAGRARELGLDPRRCLENNDAYAFFDALGALLRPGPTHTNVMDLQIALAAPAA